MKLNKRELKKNIILFVIVIFITIIFLEIFLRLFFPQKIYNECYDYENLSNVEVKLDPFFGWVLKTNFSGCQYQPDTDKIIYQTHNSKGIRSNKEIPYEKEGKKRVILLGDSMTYGFGLNDSETIAIRLQENFGEEYEVIPLASSGYSTGQELELFREEGLKYSPDIVILFFYQNDFLDTQITEHAFADSPVFNLIDGRLILNNYPTNTTWIKGHGIKRTSILEEKPLSAFLLRYSHLYSLWFHKKPKLNFGLVIEKSYLFEEPGNLIQFMEKQYSQDAYNTLILGLKLFDEFGKIAEEKNFKFIVINIPQKENVDKKYQKKYVKKWYDVNEFSFDFRKVDDIFEKTLSIKNANYDYPIWYNNYAYYYNNEIYFSNYSIEYISLFDLAKNSFKNFFFKSDLHWKSSGVKLSADYITEKLKERKII